MSSKWHRKLRMSSLALALALVLALASLPLSVAAEGTTVGVGSADLDAGETVNIPVKVSDFPGGGLGMGGYDLKVDFTPGVIEVLDVLGGEYPFDDPPTKNINNAAGWVNLATFQAKEVNQPTGDFTIAYLKVKATGDAGTSTDLMITINELVDTNADPVAATPENGKVTIKALPSPARVSTVNQWGIVAMIALFVGLLVWTVRRRRLAS